MRFDGEWLLCDDRVVRPVLRCEILAADSSWRAAELLIDTGADRTFMSANVLETLRLQGDVTESRIGGIGGTADCVAVTTQLRFTRADLVKVLFRGASALNHPNIVTITRSVSTKAVEALLRSIKESERE